MAKEIILKKGETAELSQLLKFATPPNIKLVIHAVAWKKRWHDNKQMKIAESKSSYRAD